MAGEQFGQLLSTLRAGADLTNRELAIKANVPRSFVAGLQSGQRKCGELQARKIGTALGLKEAELESFILFAIDTSTEKILVEAKDYPASFLNMTARQLRWQTVKKIDANRMLYISELAVMGVL